MRRTLLALLWTAATLALTLAALLGLIVIALGTESGTRQSLALLQRLLPELSITTVAGNWLDGVTVGELRYQDSGIDLRLQGLETRLSGGALFAGQLRLPHLAAHNLSIVLLDEEQDETPLLPLATAAMPVPLIAPGVKLGALQIFSGDEPLLELQELGTDLQWFGTRLRYADAHARLDDWQAQATGTLVMENAYPLALNGRVAGSSLPQALHINTDGDLQQLEVELWTAGRWSLRGNGRVRLLDDGLPLAARLELTQAVVLDVAGEPLTLRSATLEASGSLEQLEGELRAVVEESRYGRSELHMPLRYRPDQLVAEPRLQLGSGELQVTCGLALQAPYPLDCNGEATDLSLTPWFNGINGLSGLDGVVSTPLRIALQLQDALNLEVELPAFSGQLGGHALNGELALASADGERWQLPRLAIGTANNRLSASGVLGPDADNRLDLTLSARALAELIPELTGSFDLSAELAGVLDEPSLRARFEGASLRYDDMDISRVSGELNIARLGREASDAHIALSGVNLPGVTGLSATLRADGNRASHRLRLDAAQVEPANSARLRCDGALGDDFDSWRLRCPVLDGSLQLARKTLAWELREPLAFEWRSTPAQLALQPFCLIADGAEFCLGKPLRWRDGQLQALTASARGLPLRWADPWLPGRLRASDDAVANLDVALQSGAPLRLTATLDASGSSWHWRHRQQRQLLTLERLHATLSADEKQAQLRADILSPDLGTLSATLDVAEPRDKRTLRGELVITDLQLPRLGWLTDEVEIIAGQIDGRIAIAGSAAQPALDGLVTLRGGEILSEQIGEEALRDISADLRFDQRQARLDGRFALGNGGGAVTGESHWEGDDWQLQARLDASQLSFIPMPDSEVVVSPRLTVEAGPNQLRLSGEIAVDRADIRIEELPPETIAVSPDTEVVGREQARHPVQGFAIDLGVNLGENFHFSGFGADIDLTGQLRLRQQPAKLLRTNGRVRVTQGRYRAYGQRLIVREGSLFFSGAHDNPELNLEAIREMPPTIDQVEVEVGLRVTGPLKNPQARLFSRPGMPESDIAYYLLTGSPPPEEGASGGFTAGGTLLSLGLMGGEDQAARLAQRFGIRDLKIGTTETARGTEAEVGGYLTSKLYVRYGAGLEDQGNSVTFQYRLTPRLLVEAISGVDDALDLLYTFTIDRGPKTEQ